MSFHLARVIVVVTMVGKMVNLLGNPLFMDIRQVRLDVICLKGGRGLCDVWKK